MTLEEGTKKILANTMGWIDSNRRSAPGWAQVNFASVFLHNCQIIRSAPKFQKWGNMKFLKSRWLSHDFDGRSLTRIRFNITGLDVHNMYDVYDFNYALQECLSNKSYLETAEYKAHLANNKEEAELKLRTLSDGQLVDLTEIQNFKF